MLPFGPRLKLHESRPRTKGKLLHNTLVIYSVTDIDIWDIGEICNSRIEIQHVGVFIIVCHIGC